jgi:GNAT superfamily N-acetyltransferase
MTVRIRAAGPSDVPAIISVGEQTWPATYGFAGPEYIAHGLATWWSPEAIERSLEDTTVLVAADGDTVIGIGNLDLRGDVPIIWKLYVVPGSQGSGAGSALLRELIALAGDRPVRLEYVDGNARAAVFYARHGFTEISREPGTPPIVWVERLGSAV